MVPEGLPQESNRRGFYDVETSLRHECWACPDTPCINFPSRAVGETEHVVALPVDPDESVCPVDAIALPEFGSIPIITDECVGCGACVRACPIGAIRIDSVSQKAVVEAPAGLVPEAAFDEKRKARSRSLRWASPASDLVSPPVRIRIAYGSSSHLSDQQARKFARSAFRVDGLRSDLAVTGDNGPWPEAVAQSDDQLMIMEVTSGVDLLDPLRRLLVSHAHVYRRLSDEERARKRLSMGLISGGVPSRRTDSYRLMSDIWRYLGMRTSLLTTEAVMLLLSQPGKLKSWVQSSIDWDFPPVEQVGLGLRKLGFGADLAASFMPEK